MKSYKLKLEPYKEFIPDFDAFIEAMNTTPVPRVRRNSLKFSLEEFEKHYEGRLEREDIWLESWQSRGETTPGRWREHKLGHFFIQGLSSQLPVLALDPQPGEICLDLCAAPGGKTVHMAELMKNTGLIMANEPSFSRARVLSAVLDKMGVTNTVVTKFRGQNFEAPMLFDRILADVPCSAEGSSRGPGGENEDETKEGFRETLHGIQRKILLRAFDLLKPGGTLVYSTCTFDPRENEMAILHLLNNREGVKVVDVDFSHHFMLGLNEWKGTSFHSDINKTFRVYPHQFDSWGFYCAKIVKS